VSALKRFKSEERRQGSPPSLPMTPFSATAATNVIFISDRNRRTDRRFRDVILEDEIREGEAKQILNFRVQSQLRQWSGRSQQLQAGLVKMIMVQMRIAQGMNELTGLQPGYLRNHVGQQRV